MLKRTGKKKGNIKNVQELPETWTRNYKTKTDIVYLKLEPKLIDKIDRGTISLKY